MNVNKPYHPSIPYFLTHIHFALALTGELQSCVKGYAAYRESLLPSEPRSSLADASDRIKAIDQAANIASPLHHVAKPEIKDAHNPKSSSIAPASPSPKAHGPLAPKLKSRQMLEHIAHLMAESVKASEEKLALAASAYDSVSLGTRIDAHANFRLIPSGG